MYPTNKISLDCQRIFDELGNDANALSLDMLGVKIFVLRHPHEIKEVTSAAGLNTFGKNTADKLGDWLGAPSPSFTSSVRFTLCFDVVHVCSMLDPKSMQVHATSNRVV